MNENINLFKQTALESGYSQEEIDSFVSSIDSMGGNNFNTPSISSSVSGQEPQSMDMIKPNIPSMPENLKPLTIPQQTAPASFNETPSIQQTQVANIQPNVQPIKAEGVPVITQAFGNRSSVEKYSGGVNLGTDFRAKTGTELNSPEGIWVVDTAKEGFNDGSGNMVKIINTETNESLTYEHLNNINVIPGQKLDGSQVVGLSGNTGNSTAEHASIPYRNSKGEYKDVLSTPYAQQVFAKKEPKKPEVIDVQAPEATSSAGFSISDMLPSNQLQKLMKSGK